MGGRRDRWSAGTLIRVGLVVDGPGEFAAFKARFGGRLKVVKTDGPRGANADPRQIIARLGKQVEMLRSLRCDCVVLVTDFESRSGSYKEFVGILGEAGGERFGALFAGAGVPNQMIENWYLADIAYISRRRSYLHRVKSQKRYEGMPGKEVLRRHFRRGHYYKETTHGPSLMTAMRFQEARKVSPSLDAFIMRLEAVECSVADSE